MYFILRYELTDDYLEKRAPLRKDHLQLIQDYHADGKLQMAGAFDDSKLGTILIFKASEKSEIEKFVKADPYYINGLISAYSIDKWNCVIDHTGMLI